MPARSTKLPELLRSLEEGTLLLTPDAAAAASWRRLHDDAQRQAGKQLWQPANILCWNEWLRRLHTELVVAGHEERILLNAAQEHSLWREVVLADPEHSLLAPADSLAELAFDGFRTASAWQVETNLRHTAVTHDARRFAAWVEHFQRMTSRDHLLPGAQLERALVERLRQHHVPLLKRILLLGFDEVLPAQVHLLDAFASAGTRVVELAYDHARPVAHSATVLPDETKELRFGLRWLRHYLDAHPGHHAAIVVPDLQEIAPTLEPLLGEIFAPWIQDVAAENTIVPWQNDIASPLRNNLMVRSAIDLLAWVLGPLSLQRLSALLTSPYTGLAPDPDAAARFDAFVIQPCMLLRPEMTLFFAQQLAREKPQHAAIAEWLYKLHQFAMETAALPPRRSFAQWTDTLWLLLKTASWADARPLDAQETEVREAFASVVDQMATLDFQPQRVTLTEFAREFERQLGATATPTHTAANIHIMTPEAAASQVFDALLFLRATDDKLPSPLRAHPLIDRNLQRAHGMPGTDGSLDLQRAQRLFAKLLQAAPTALFTTAAESPQAKLRPSPFLSTIPEVAACTLLPPEQRDETVQLESFADIEPLPLLPSPQVRGGARVLKQQAACGFLAFAELRLGGHDIESGDAGFNAIDSGNVLHEALEEFWRETKSQAELLAMDQQQRHQAIVDAVDKALQRYRTQDRWDVAYLALYRERMISLLHAWMPFELERGPFTVIAFEEKTTASIGPLELTLRMDRIDRVRDNGMVYIDYKTGASATPSSWAGDRPEEPQLPLYALQGEVAQLSGLAFARLRAGEQMQYQGWAIEDGILPEKGSTTVDFEDHVAAWKDALTNLAHQFADGRAEVAPKDPTVNCKHCAQRLLCRVNIDALLQHVEESEEASHG
ncbi:PD-(D/E)XK nuclease family protein [Granulicella cerasi]|uniref:PD-(D/E)XK nuclease family protein n=1 Tax=Granulicella cerasi TaxID=741063 RepID=A0ABW1Z5C3_9BACT|nr:PD-(D/E)XK nuclease family protein [Granulicella cerasi]